MIKKLNLFKSKKNDQIGLVKFKEGDLVYFIRNKRLNKILIFTN
jgi:hypothetical protein